jgi:4'-phosphopantetheinyl transferase EntD
MESSIETLPSWIEAQGPLTAALESLAGEIEPLWGDEWRLIAAAAPIRRRSFAAGRAAARRALTRLGEAKSAIPARAEGDPLWPPGVVGAITHTHTWALAAAARRKALSCVGLDLEGDDPLDADLIDLVCRPDEGGPLPELTARGIDAPKLRFVAKEAAYKAVFPVDRRFIDFRSARVAFNPSCNRFSVEVVGSAVTSGLEGFFTSGPGWLCALCFRRA